MRRTRVSNVVRALGKKSYSKKKLRLSNQESDHGEASLPFFFEQTDFTPEQTARILLCDYNNKHGTDLELVRSLNENCFSGSGYVLDFVNRHDTWVHTNFLARRRSEPSGEELVLFAEAYLVTNEGSDTFALNTLSLVNPTTDHVYGCPRCYYPERDIKHPRYGYRAGFGPLASGGTTPSTEEADEWSKFALRDYNDKNGTNLKFESVVKCNSFSCAGLWMDFSRKNAKWMHMNLKAKRPGCGFPEKDKELLLFAELYFEDDDNCVLATLSIVEPIDNKSGCRYCPDDIHHPYRAFRLGYDDLMTPLAVYIA